MTLFGGTSSSSPGTSDDSAAQAIQSIFNDGCDPVRLFGRIEPFVVERENLDQWIAAIRREYPFRVSVSADAGRLVRAIETATRACGLTPYELLSAVSDRVRDVRDIGDWAGSLKEFVREAAGRN